MKRKKQDENRLARIEGLLEIELLRQRRVTALGAGSFTSPLVEQFARHGVASGESGRIRIIDGDVVEARNLVGTHYTHAQIGKPKVEALTEIVNGIDPNTNVSVMQRRLGLDDIPDIEQLAAQSDLLIYGIDDFDIFEPVVDRCYNLCPILAGFFGPNCAYAEIGFSIPAQTPSLARTMGRRQRSSIARPRAAGFDTEYVANVAAAVAMSLLLGGAMGSELFHLYADAPLILIGLRPAWVFSNLPPGTPREIVLVGAPVEPAAS